MLIFGVSQAPTCFKKNWGLSDSNFSFGKSLHSLYIFWFIAKINMQKIKSSDFDH